MSPAVMDGQMALVDWGGYDRIQYGDIVDFWSAYYGAYVCHRVIGGLPDHWKTRGDANPTADPGFVDRENYVSTVILLYSLPGRSPRLVRPFGGARAIAPHPHL